MQKEGISLDLRGIYYAWSYSHTDAVRELISLITSLGNFGTPLNIYEHKVKPGNWLLRVREDKVKSNQGFLAFGDAVWLKDACAWGQNPIAESSGALRISPKNQNLHADICELVNWSYCRRAQRRYDTLLVSVEILEVRRLNQCLVYTVQPSNIFFWTWSFHVFHHPPHMQLARYKFVHEKTRKHDPSAWSVHNEIPARVLAATIITIQSQFGGCHPAKTSLPLSHSPNASWVVR